MPTSRIAATFARLGAHGRCALIPFITAGDPQLALTVPLMHALVKAGADILELGVPFSDPMADGPVIQRASERALANRVGLADVLDTVAAFRAEDPSTPVVLMGYANPIEAMGYDTFAQRARAAGVDGVLTVDYPPEECADYVACLDHAGLDPIFLVSPTTLDRRIEAVAKYARGFVYYVSLKGVTGASHMDLNEVAAKLAHLRQRIALPLGVGFGIRDGETARRVAQFSDAVVIGSRIVSEIEESPQEAVLTRVHDLVRSIRQAMDTQA